MRFKVGSQIIGGLVLLLVAVLAACGGPSPAVSLTLSSSSATVLRGQSVTVDVTLVRSGGASGDVVLSADVPTYPDVKATFTPPTLTGSILSSTLTIDVGTDADDGPVTIMVSAGGNGVAASQEFTLSVDSLTVSGSVVALFGEPVAGVNVSSQGMGAVTAADGSFALAGLSVPYDVTLFSTADQWVHVFEGMTVPDPVLMPLATSDAGDTPKTADLSGTLTGATVPVAAGHVLLVCAEAVTLPSYGGCTKLAAGESTYLVTLKWDGPATAPVRIHALEYAVDADDLPTLYGGYGVAETTLTDGGTLTQDVALSAGPGTTTFSGYATAAAGVTATDGYVALRFSDNLDMVIAPFDPTVPFSLPMPNLPNATFDALAIGATAGGGQSIAWQVGSTESAALLLAAPPVLVTPPAGTTDVTVATQFKATNESGTLLTFIWVPNGSTPSFAVTTAGDTASIPDVAGVALPPSADYNVTMLGSTGFATVDAGSQNSVQDYFAFRFMLGSGGAGPSTNGGMVLAPAGPFTTAP